MTLRVQVVTALCIVLVIGFAVRTQGLARIGVWHDEVLTLMHLSGKEYKTVVTQLTTASQNGPVPGHLLVKKYQTNGHTLKQTIRALMKDEPEHAPTFFASLYLWEKLFGSETYVLRLLSVLFGTLSLVAFFWFAYELLRSLAPALIATAMLTFSPLHVSYSQELREYSLYMLVFSLSCAIFLRAWRTNQLRDWILYAVTSVLAVYCTMLMLLVLLAQVLFSTSTLGIKRLTKARFLRATANKWVVHLATTSPALLSLLLYSLNLNLHVAHQQLIWLAAPGHVPNTVINGWLMAPLLSWCYVGCYDTHPNHPFYTSLFTSIRPSVLVPIVLVELFFCAIMIRQKRWQFGFLMSIFLVYTAVFLGVDLVTGGIRSVMVRYYLPIPMLALLPVSLFLCDLWQSRRAYQQTLVAVALALLLAVELQADAFLVQCPRFSTRPFAQIFNSNPTAPVLVDVELDCDMLTGALAISPLLDKSHPFTFAGHTIPDWLYTVDSVYLIRLKPTMKEKYSGFEVIGGQRGTCLIRPRRSNETSTPLIAQETSAQTITSSVQLMKLKRSSHWGYRWYWWITGQIARKCPMLKSGL